LTEIDSPLEQGLLVGPYIKANTFAEAKKIAEDHDLTLVGELHELIVEDKVKDTIH
jgi:uncharacterized protein YdeI (BOF family)|tara:strand:+ start:203 stop:370 length:168 start_codon:yes stop_codon:yes gene_type:complete